MNANVDQAPSFLITKGKPFKCEFVLRSALEEAFDFAYEHTVGKKLNLSTIFWGSKKTQNIAEFAKAFRGKLCEIGLKKFFSMYDLSVRKPKTAKNWQVDKYENFEFEVNKKRILVKSIPHYSNLLLLDTELWDTNASYGKNSRNRIKYDFFVLTRIKPGTIHLFENFELTKNKEVDKDLIRQIVFSKNYQFEVTGYLDQTEIKVLNDMGHIIPKGSIVNGNKVLGHEYYYCQTGDLNDVRLLINRLKFS